MVLLTHHWSVSYLPHDCLCAYLRNHNAIYQVGISKTKITKQNCQCTSQESDQSSQEHRDKNIILEFTCNSSVSFTFIFDLV